MSGNHPLYEALRRLDHPGAWWWRVGDITYYLGVIPAFLLGAGGVLTLIGLAAGWNDWRVAAKTISLCVFSSGIAAVGRLMRRRAFRLAARDGIEAEEPPPPGGYLG